MIRRWSTHCDGRFYISSGIAVGTMEKDKVNVLNVSCNDRVTAGDTIFPR